MTIPIEFISLVIRRSALDRVFKGGSEAFIQIYGPFDGRVNAFDDSLVKFGAMSSNDIFEIAKRLEALGLIGVSKEGSEEIWKDFCVVDELSGPTLRCDWISYDLKTRSVTLK